MKNPLTVSVTGRNVSTVYSSEDQLYRLSAAFTVPKVPLVVTVEYLRSSDPRRTLVLESMLLPLAAHFLRKRSNSLSPNLPSINIDIIYK